MALFFVRHGEAIVNTMSEDERAGADAHNRLSPLTDRGKMQASIMGEYLEDIFGSKQFHLAFESDFTRSQETLDIILSKLTKKPKIRRKDARLNEKWDGIFHEMTQAQIEEGYPEQLRLKKRAGNYFYRAPGGENFPDVELRIRSLLDEYQQRMFFSKNTLIVGHGRWFLALQRLILDQSEQEMMKRYDVPIANCSLTLFESVQKKPRVIVPWVGKIPAGKTEFG